MIVSHRDTPSNASTRKRRLISVSPTTESVIGGRFLYVSILTGPRACPQSDTNTGTERADESLRGQPQRRPSIGSDQPGTGVHILTAKHQSGLDARSCRVLPNLPRRDRGAGCAGADVALTLFVDAVLPQQHDNTREQPHHLVVEYRLRGPLLTAELVRQCLKLFQK